MISTASSTSTMGGGIADLIGVPVNDIVAGKIKAHIDGGLGKHIDDPIRAMDGDSAIPVVSVHFRTRSDRVESLDGESINVDDTSVRIAVVRTPYPSALDGFAMILPDLARHLPSHRGDRRSCEMAVAAAAVPPDLKGLARMEWEWRGGVVVVLPRCGTGEWVGWGDHAKRRSERVMEKSERVWERFGSSSSLFTGVHWRGLPVSSYCRCRCLRRCISSMPFVGLFQGLLRVGPSVDESG